MTATTTANAPALNMQGETAEDLTASMDDKLTGRARSLANLRPARPGEVRNPTGRGKRDLDLAKAARRHAERAIAVLAACMDDEAAQWSVRTTAAAELLDRGYGRAPQTIDLNAKVDVSEAFEAFVRELSDRRAGRLPQKPVPVIEHDGEEE